MEIARDMNLVIPVETSAGNIYVHATPITKAVYREHFFILSKTYAAILGEGLGVIAGPRVAYLMLERLAVEANSWEGATGVKNTLVQEIIKNANIVIPVEGKGWDDMPLAVALDKNLIDPDEVLGELVFFTCVFAINKPRMAATMMEAVNGLSDSVLTSLNVTAWVTSLPISTPGDSTGETPTTLSVPS